MGKNDTEQELKQVEEKFHELINELAGHVISDPNLKYPDLSKLLEQKDCRAYFEIPGRYGGFDYRLTQDREHYILLVESWCRIVEKTGLKYKISKDSFELLND